eukprot:6181184-Pleurochrysis_carterae.AAC.1
MDGRQQHNRTTPDWAAIVSDQKLGGGGLGTAGSKKGLSPEHTRTSAVVPPCSVVSEWPRQALAERRSLDALSGRTRPPPPPLPPPLPATPSRPPAATSPPFSPPPPSVSLPPASSATPSATSSDESSVPSACSEPKEALGRPSSIGSLDERCWANHSAAAAAAAAAASSSLIESVAPSSLTPMPLAALAVAAVAATAVPVAGSRDRPLPSSPALTLPPTPMPL